MYGGVLLGLGFLFVLLLDIPSKKRCPKNNDTDEISLLLYHKWNIIYSSESSFIVTCTLCFQMIRNFSRVQSNLLSRYFSKPTTTTTTTSRTFQSTTTLAMGRKAGVSSPEELKQFVEEAGERLLVVDVRNPDATVEPGDQKSLAVAALPSDTNRPQAVSLIYDRESKSMPLPDTDKDTPIITHCGGGGRGQLAKDFLMENGFTNVLNGGGPKETDCWNEFGDK